MWGTLDYPSIGQVRAKLQENDIIPIFSSVDDLEEAYLVCDQDQFPACFSLWEVHGFKPMEGVWALTFFFGAMRLLLSEAF